MTTRRNMLLITLVFSLVVTGHAFGDSPWLDNYDVARKQAQQSEKDLLIYFSGSDFCPTCITLDKEVLSQPDFLRQVEKEYVLLQIDFPKNKQLPASIQQQNARLKAQFTKDYRFESLPTLYLANAQGIPYAKTGVREGGVTAYQQHLAFLKRAKPMQDSGSQWLEDMEVAKAKAAYLGKDLLIDFTGSDWCGWCMRLDKEIFSQEAFKTKASQAFVFVKLDFPKYKKQSERIVKQNRQIAAEFGSKYGYDQSYPAIYLATADRIPYARTGYEAIAPEAYAEAIVNARQEHDKQREGTN